MATILRQRLTSGFTNKALANANLILQPPENDFVCIFWSASEKPKPARSRPALAGPVSASMSTSFCCISPNRSESSSFSALSPARASFVAIFSIASSLALSSADSVKSLCRQTSAWRTESRAVVSSPAISCSTYLSGRDQ